MKLSERLELVLSFVEPGESAADVGTDHGHVPVELVRRAIVKKAVAMDVRKGPLSRATENIALAGLADKIETRLSDGVAKLQPGEADSVVIAGMGGELIIKILENGRHMWDSVKQWVLSPQSEIFKVRRWLFENGFVIRKEDMVLEDGKFYTVMDVRREKDADSEGKTVDPDVLSLSGQPHALRRLSDPNEESGSSYISEGGRDEASAVHRGSFRESGGFRTGGRAAFRVEITVKRKSGGTA